MWGAGLLPPGVWRAGRKRGGFPLEPALLEGLKRAFDLADARPDLLRQESAES